MTKHEVDIAIVGGGVVGAAAALWLAQGPWKIALIDKQDLTIPAMLPEMPYDLRVFAINLLGAQLFQKIAVWEQIRIQRLSQFDSMQVWDSTWTGHCQFDSTDIGRLQLGYIIEQSVLLSALYQALPQRANILVLGRTALEKIHRASDEVLLQATDKNIHARLLIAADGSQSWVRNQCQFVLDQLPYHQQALVANVTCTQPHQQSARQVFLPTGPLAFLPFADPHHCSIVWSADDVVSDELMALTPEVFCQRLAQAFNARAGAVSLLSKRARFPLQWAIAQQLVQERVVLLGDSAHVVHPLAGQGLNLGLEDVVTLGAVLFSAHAKSRDPFALDTLMRYQRLRRPKVALMAQVFDGLLKTYRYQARPLQIARTLGMNGISNWRAIRRFLISEATCPDPLAGAYAKHAV